MDLTRTPVLIGTGQITNRVANVPEDALPPHELILQASRAAAEDTGAPDVLSHVQALRCVQIIGWQYATLPQRIADGLGINPTHMDDNAMGGNSPQRLVNETATAIGRGELDCALLVGGESVASRRKAHRAGIKLEWPKDENLPDRTASLLEGISPEEYNHALFHPVMAFSIYENAIRAEAGESIEEHQRKLGEQCAAFASVAKHHPNAWLQNGRTPEEVHTVTPTNRMISFPYPKYMCSLAEVDQAAALIVCSAAKAQALGVPEDRWVYIHGGADHRDRDFLSTRVSYTRSHAAAACAEQALAQAHTGLDDIEFIDLYSCFPSVPQFAKRAWNLQRPWEELTLTGGLANFGGPWNNYSMHAIATGAGKLREKPDAKGLVYAIGFWATKQSVGIYSGRPLEQGYQEIDPTPYAEGLLAHEAPAFVERREGPATIEGYTVSYSREGDPEVAHVFSRLGDGSRTLGLVHDSAMLQWMVENEATGAHGVAGVGQDGLGTFALTEG